MNPALKDFDFFKKKPSAPAAASPPAQAVPVVCPPITAKPLPHPARNQRLVDVNVPKGLDNPADPAARGVASVTLDVGGRIISVDEGCKSMFGWKERELAGQHLRVMLKEGSDKQLATFLQQPRGVETNGQILSLRVVARRMDGREFPASLTRLTWTSDTARKAKSGSVQECWTAVFRELPPSSDLACAPPPAPYEETHVAPGPSAARMEDVPQFQGSPAALRSANEELQKKLEAMAVEAWKKSEALNKADKERAELAQQLGEFEKTKAALAQEIEGRKLLETQLQELIATTANLEQQVAQNGRGKQETEKQAAELREQLSAAKLAAERAESARQQETARADGYKVALTNLQHAYDELNAKVGTDIHSSAHTRRRIEELESVVRGTTAEAERANAELERRMAERNRLETEWQEQVKAARATAERADAALQQEIMRSNRLERDLAALRQSYDEVNGKFTTDLQSTAETRRRIRELETMLRESEEEAERANALVQKQSAERARRESEWMEQVNAAKAAAERAEAAYKQEVARANRVERELAKIQQNLEELDAKLATEQHSASEARRRAKEMELSLRESAAERERASAERERLENELRTQLAATRADHERSQNAVKERTAEFSRLERDIASLREEREELRSKYSTEKAAGVKARRRIKELEKQVRSNRGTSGSDPELHAELAEVKAAAEEAASEARKRIEDLESRLRQNAAELARAKAALDNTTVRSASESASELNRLRENQAAQAAEVSELERRVRESAASLARANADADKERAERRRVEQRFATLSTQVQELHEQLRRHLDSEKSSQNRVNEIEEKLRQWNQDSKAA